MELDEWAQRWNVPPAALDDLRARLGMIHDGRAVAGISEAAVQSIVRLEATRVGARLWRNNVGATHTPEGSFIRYGLANESSTVNARVKSADLIGIRPVHITRGHVGCIIGQFVSREVKAGNWRYTGTDREQAQLRWAELILSFGGDAAFATGEGTL